jgi:hypothetical protein
VYLTPSTSVSSSIHDTNDVAEEEGPPRYNFMDSSRDANRNLVLPKSSSSSLAAKVGPKTRKPNGTSREQENVKDDPTEKNAFSDDKKNDDDGFHHQRNNTLPAVAVAVATTVALKPVDDAARRPRLRTNVNQTIVTFNSTSHSTNQDEKTSSNLRNNSSTILLSSSRHRLPKGPSTSNKSSTTIVQNSRLVEAPNDDGRPEHRTTPLQKPIDPRC